MRHGVVGELVERRTEHALHVVVEGAEAPGRSGRMRGRLARISKRMSSRMRRVDEGVTAELIERRAEQPLHVVVEAEACCVLQRGGGRMRAHRRRGSRGCGAWGSRRGAAEESLPLRAGAHPEGRAVWVRAMGRRSVSVLANIAGGVRGLERRRRGGGRLHAGKQAYGEAGGRITRLKRVWCTLRFVGGARAG